jgi:hypothetical protein
MASALRRGRLSYQSRGEVESVLVINTAVLSRLEV